MIPENFTILTINAGSSSIKFALYNMQKERLFFGKIMHIGTPHASLTSTGTQEQETVHEINAPDLNTACSSLVSYLGESIDFTKVKAIGHRVVHGMRHKQAEVITGELLTVLKDIAAYDPDHLPAEIALITLLRNNYPGILSVACFDTAFHAGMPVVARMLPLPRRYYTEAIERYGFHGLSYAYLLQELQKNGRGGGRIIMAHLGSGASLAAVKDGRCIDTSMGFTPVGGTVMGTRSGDIDPGVCWYLMEKEKMDAVAFSNLINHQSGLLGVSGISADMEELLLQEPENVHAKEAVDLFCYSVKKWIGSFTAVLGGLDTLVFSGGIGERSAIIRSRICAGMEYAGININETLNQADAYCISTEKSIVPVLVIPTDEAQMMAAITTAIYQDCITG